MPQDILQSLKLKGYAPRTLLDIGANIGDFTRGFLSEFTSCVPTLIEPNPHCLKQLKTLPYEVIGAAASDTNGTAEIYLTSEWLESTGASLYRENTVFFRDEVVVKETVQTVRLDEMLVGRSFDFVKIDVQGAELDVLNGGTEVIRKADYILIEVPIVEYNSGAPPAERLFEKLTSMGFRCVDAVKFHRLGSVLGGNLLQVDFLFERLVPRASQNYQYAKFLDTHPHIIEFIREQKSISPDFSVLNIGPLTTQWAGSVDAVFDRRAYAGIQNSFTGNLSDRAAWEPLLQHVAKHGKFSYSVCTHVLEDLSLPSVALEMLPRIAEAGHICVSSKFMELIRQEGPYRGFIHHRWIFCFQKSAMVLVPKISLVDHMPFENEELVKQHPELWEAQIFWRKGLDFSILNDDYLGPTPEEVVKMYAAILMGQDT